MNKNTPRSRGGRRAAPRASKRRANTRSRLWLAAVPLTLILLWLLLTHYVFIIRRVEVKGLTSLDEQTVARQSGVRLGDRMASVDEHILAQNLESTGTVAYQGMRRRYPSTLRLMVRERSKDALVLQAGKVLVVDEDGYVVSVEDRLPAASMPYITGLKASAYKLGRQLDASEGQLDAMKTVLDALKARDAQEYVSEINLELVKNLKITSRTGITVLLGDSDNMNDKITWMVGALKDLERRGETLGRLDVSSGSKADYLSLATPTPVPTPVPTPSPPITPTPDPMSALAGDLVPTR